jgi:hypothetical protein
LRNGELNAEGQRLAAAAPRLAERSLGHRDRDRERDEDERTSWSHLALVCAVTSPTNGQGRAPSERDADHISSASGAVTPVYVEILATSAIEVTPALTFWSPCSRRVSMPCSRAIAEISASAAPAIVSSLISSVIGITEKSPMRDR